MIKFFNETTTFEEKLTFEGLSFPSITVCFFPDDVEDNFTTFEDVMTAIEKRKSKYRASLFIFWQYGEETWNDLLNPNILSQYYNTTLENVIDYSSGVMPAHFPYPIHICVTLNPPQMSKKKFLYASVSMCTFCTMYNCTICTICTRYNCTICTIVQFVQLYNLHNL